jgi:hypothetical protein
MKKVLILIPVLVALAFIPTASASLSINTNQGSLNSANGLSPATSVLTQNVEVSWNHGKWQGNSNGSYSVPGIGSGVITCQPDTTWIKFTPSNPSNETSMWTDVQQTKSDGQEDAVKEGRVYTFANPGIKVKAGHTGGSGLSTDEGFNQDTPVENSSVGAIYGLISTRNGFNQPAGTSPPPTSFSLNWKWNGFSNPKKAACDVTATFTTEVAGNGQSGSSQELQTLSQADSLLLQQPDQPQQQLSTGKKINDKGVVNAVAASSMNLNWTGESDIPASLKDASTMSIPGVADIAATCPAGIDSAASLLLNVTDEDITPEVDVVTYQGQGTEAASDQTYYENPDDGTIGPIALPVNGLVRFSISGAPDGTVLASGIVSSVRKTNDPNPNRNYCQIAGQTLQADQSNLQTILQLLQ